MDRRLRLIVYRGDAIYDNIVVERQCVLRYDWVSGGDVAKSTGNNGDTRRRYVARPTRLCTRGLVAYLVSAYVATLSSSYVYRKSALRMLFGWLHVRSLDRERVPVILVRLGAPRRQFLDYKWNERLMQMVQERQEADHAMSWLSTLGGAFSALGEEFERCAEMAGKISVRQFELALRLDNPLLVARCRLYSALSLIQRGCFRTPRYTIKRIYKFAHEERDIHLQNMCQGMWAKLQYCYKQYKQRKRFASSEMLQISIRN